ncbi:MAG TPA: hypothetical protein VN922_23235 [Bacteroidia bacterium]|nr:hypothetical protein [Bacteroidia bacterium]
MKKKIVTVTTLIITVYIVTALMLATAIIYFLAASESYSEISQLTSQSSIDKADIMRTTNEMLFFTIVGIAYILVGFWIVKRKYRSKVPYIVAIAGSAALIVFYIATRTISLPNIGLEAEIGITDTVAKVLQGLIIAGSLFILGSSKRFATINK